LRNVLRTAPYMHNGLFELDGVLNMYNVGMPEIQPKPGQEQDPLFPVKSPHLQRLDLSPAEKADLKAFLESLTERKRRVRAPQLPAIGDA
jgi:cytochrome c peroxidase